MEEKRLSLLSSLRTFCRILDGTSSKFFILRFPLFFVLLFFALCVCRPCAIDFIRFCRRWTYFKALLCDCALVVVFTFHFNRSVLIVHSHTHTACCRSLEFRSNLFRRFALRTTKSMRENSSCTSYHAYTLKCFIFLTISSNIQKLIPCACTHTPTNDDDGGSLARAYRWTQQQQHTFVYAIHVAVAFGFFRFHFRFFPSLSVLRLLQTRESNRIGENIPKSMRRSSRRRKSVSLVRTVLTHIYTHSFTCMRT